MTSRSGAVSTTAVSGKVGPPLASVPAQKEREATAAATPQGDLAKLAADGERLTEIQGAAELRDEAAIVDHFEDHVDEVSLAGVPTSELALIKLARSRAQVEKEKGLRWFVVRGQEPPTRALLEVAEAQRRTAIERLAAQLRASDRHRSVAEGLPTVFVPCEAHPAIADASRGSTAVPEGVAFVSANASRLAMRQHLLASFTNVCWIAMARSRLERRLQLLQQRCDRRQGEGADAAGTALNDHAPSSRAAGAKSLHVPTTRGTPLIQMPDFIATAAVGGPAVPQGGSPSNGSNIASNGIGPLRGASASASGPAAAALSGASELPTASAELTTFRRKEMKDPFLFKLKGYSTMRWTEHPLLCRDGQAIVPNFPAGNQEVAEKAPPMTGVSSTAGAHHMDPSASAQDHLLSVSHFTPPLVTLDTFSSTPAAPFTTVIPADAVYVKTLRPIPTLPLVDMAPPAAIEDHGHALPSLVASHLAAVADLLRPATVPGLQRRRAPEDDLSDSDTEAVDGGGASAALLEATTGAQKPRSIHDVAKMVGSLFGASIFSAPTTTSAASSDQATPATGGNNAAGSKASWLSPPVAPVHGVGRHSQNVAIATRRQAAAAADLKFSQVLPPSLQRVY